MADDIVGSARIKVELDDDLAQRQARTVARRLAKAFQEAGKEAGDGFTRDAEGRLRDSRGRLAKEGEKLGKSAGEGAARGASLLTKALAAAGKGLLFYTAGAGAVTALGISLANTVVNATRLSAALAPAAGIVAALPAGALQAAAAVGTLRLGLVGVSDAIEAAFTGDLQDFQEAMQRLSPAARAMAVELRGVRPELEALRLSVQEALFAPLQGEITRLVGVLRGPLQQGMVGVASQFGRLGLAVTRFAGSAAGVHLITGVFDTLQHTLASIRSDTIDRLLLSVGSFVTTTLPAFDDLGTAIDTALNRLSAFLEEAVISGDALIWVNDAVTVFRQLGAVVADTFGVIFDVFAIVNASGNNALGGITAVLEGVRAFLASAQGQATIVSVFQSLQEVGSQLSPVISALLVLLGRLAPIIADLADSVSGTLVGAFDALGEALTAIGPGTVAVFERLQEAIASANSSGALTDLAGGAGDLLEALAPLLPAVINVAGGLGQLAPAASLLAAVLTPVVAVVAAVADAFDSLPGPLQAAVLSLGTMVALRGRVAAFGATLAALPAQLSARAIGVATRGLGVLRSGLAGLLGVFGGPWGLAITAGVTALSLFGDRQSEAAQKVSDLTATLDEQTGKLTDNTRQWVATELQQRGILDLAKRMGIDTALVTSAVLGEAGAVTQLNDALNANVAAAQSRSGIEMTSQLQAELLNSDTLRQSVGELSAAYRSASSEALLKIEASRSLQQAEQSTATAVQLTTQAMKEQADLLRAQVDPAFAFQQALQGVADKQKAYKDAVAESGAKSREAQLASLDLARASLDLQNAAAGLGDTFTGKLTPDMRAVLSAAGLTKGQIRDVERALNDTRRAAEDYQGNYRANVEVVGADAAERRIRNLNNVIADVQRSVTIGIVANVNLRGLPAYDHGGIVDSPTVALLGERNRREVVIPLTKPERARQLAAESGLTRILGTPAAPAAAAGGGDTHHHTWNLYEVGDAEATAQRVVNRLALAGGGL
ncbi:hypothetical protein F5972_08070 [Microbispora cellulosiformans]|uniref:Tape measure protein n=1 Tax=Microbispora cellulosiformans TaxID=2614688 RepID=A0A5J5K561_9ACTN|nr:hypothetical protein [Microbispora cellulosiformans]KAA9379602.1 hypothetical protein F5972_08070 [Microbispora cellulosiformans]